MRKQLLVTSFMVFTLFLIDFAVTQTFFGSVGLRKRDACTAFAKFDADDSLLSPKIMYGNSLLIQSAIKEKYPIYQ